MSWAVAIITTILLAVFDGRAIILALLAIAAFALAHFISKPFGGLMLLLVLNSGAAHITSGIWAVVLILLWAAVLVQHEQADA